MEKFIETILESDEINIKKNINSLAFNDKIYKKDCKRRAEFEKRFLEIQLSRESLFIQDYIACIETTEERRVQLAYLAGVRDTIKFLNGLDLLKGSKKLKLKKCKKN